MNLNSHHFDRIRSKTWKAAKAATVSSTVACDHPGCLHPGEYRAPQGRDREGSYFCFCLEHVREYNATYDYFSGMSDDAGRPLSEGGHRRAPSDLEHGRQSRGWRVERRRRSPPGFAWHLPGTSPSGPNRGRSAALQPGDHQGASCVRDSTRRPIRQPSSRATSSSSSSSTRTPTAVIAPNEDKLREDHPRL